MLSLKARAVCAPTVVREGRRHAVAHTQALRRRGIAHITSARQLWWHNSNTWAVLLEDAATGEPLGGVRLQRWGNGTALPIEEALSSVDPRVHAWVASFSEHGVGELCGLWCSPKLEGFGLGSFLTRMGLALASQVDTTTILGVCDARHLDQNVSLGFKHDTTLASRGTFEYPLPGLCAHLLRLPDANQLQGATLQARASINAYRDVPIGAQVLTRSGRSLQLAHDLRLLPSSRKQAAFPASGSRSPSDSSGPHVLARHLLPQSTHERS
jgi:hypothetical protein